jgi:glycosyltransferase involved in cell wall biosynthesis
MHMRLEDWAQCEVQREIGTVSVHWTDPVDRSQFHIPMANPFVSKLASVAKRVHGEHGFDVIFSHYMEPYGIAGHLASQMTGVPHIVRMAGSDAGRLWHHPQLEPLYDHVLRSAARVIAVGTVADRAAQRGVEPQRILAGETYALPEDIFTSEGPIIDIGSVRKEVEQNPELREMLWGGFAGGKPHIGIYGKLGDKKGSFALLGAMRKLKQNGIGIGLVALAHGPPEIERRFRERTRELDLVDAVLQLPFLPHWRVPEFLRSCLAVCCLEQNFPIAFHSPIIPLEVLLCGSCLVASTEVIRKLPQSERLAHGYSCVAISDAADTEELSSKLAAIVRHPQPAALVGLRGRFFAQDCQRNAGFADSLERIFESTSRHQTPGPPGDSEMLRVSKEEEDRSFAFPLTMMAAARAGLARQEQSTARGRRRKRANDLENARLVLASLNKAIARGKAGLRSFAQAVRFEIKLATAIAEMETQSSAEIEDPLFRVNISEWALDGGRLGALIPVRARRLRILRFAHDLSRLWDVETIAEFPLSLGTGPSYVVLRDASGSSEPLLVDKFTARILDLSDGTRSCSQIVTQLNREFGCSDASDHLAWVENLLTTGLIGIRDSRLAASNRSQT